MLTTITRRTLEEWDAQYLRDNGEKVQLGA